MLQDVLGKASKVLKLAVQAASEKGASSWVTAVPTYTHETILHKRDFVDAIYIQYGWDLLNIPLNVNVTQNLVYNMPLTASWAAYEQFNTMKPETLWPNL